ncbi:hypothetical protein [Candidatus Binatus sp.]|uniref:hypothetical protein n=1 Tax=Candidatus Binatus sp. TaxID=2811406 RepID=UPI00272B5036|nr:hypothetical protein [Candidatus Binatus sp.]
MLAAECVAVFSGSGPDGEEVIANARQRLGNSTRQKISHIADMVKLGYCDLKKKRAEENILKPLLGAGFTEFQTLCGQSSSSQILQQVLGLVMRLRPSCPRSPT